MRATLTTYPGPRARVGYLCLVLAVTVAQYYTVYVDGSVSTLIIDQFDMTLAFFVSISILGNFVGGIVSLSAGIADRYGRVNLTLGGLLASSLIMLFALPNAGSKWEFMAWATVGNMVEGAVLVLTPALIRDFSPQLSRGAAMGMWALGPTLGNLAAAAIAARTLPSHPDWQFQYYLCGGFGITVLLVAAFLLRELSPTLRNQVILQAPSALATASTPKGLRGFREMFTPRIVLPAFAFGLYLFFYTSRVAFFVIYFVTTFGYPIARANALDNWSWVFGACGLLLWGFVGDKVGVRKPLILAGGLVVTACVIGWALVATRPDTGYYTFAALLAISALAGGAVTSNFLAAFSEAVEQRNPALVATGMAMWGWLLRVCVALALAGVTLLVPAASTMVDHGPAVKRIATTYDAELQTLQAMSPETRAALAADPTDPDTQRAAVGEIAGATGLTPAEAADALEAASAVPAADLAYLRAHSADVRQAAQDGPRQWQRWWWICVLGQLAFLPAVLLLPGPWRRRRRGSAEPEPTAELTPVG